MDWIDLEYAITSSSPQADMTYFDSLIEASTIDINLFTSTPMTSHKINKIYKNQIGHYCFCRTRN